MGRGLLIAAVVVGIFFASIGSGPAGTTPSPGATGDSFVDSEAGVLCPAPSEPGPRHASILKVGRVTHMVWQQALEADGKPEICYANAEGGDLGIGSADNPGRRVTFTRTASVWPEIAFDARTGIFYVAWTEIIAIPPNPTHPDYRVAAVRLAASDDGFRRTLYHATDLAYLDVWNRDLNEIEDPDLLEQAVGPDAHFRLVLLEDGSVFIQFGDGRQGRIPDKGDRIMADMDRDGIPDYWEGTGATGHATQWDLADTDFDGIWDLWEIEHGLDPVVDQTDDCELLKLCHVIAEGLLVFTDVDGDGLSFADESGDFPVTTEVALYSQGSQGTYRFWPKVSGMHNLRLRVEQRTYASGPEGCDDVEVQVAVSADGSPVTTWTDLWDDTLTAWSEETMATLPVATDFANVDADDVVEIVLAVSFSPTKCGGSTYRALAVDWLKLELDGDRSEVNYKDADDAVKVLLPVVTEEMTIQLDPLQRDVLFELDSMVGRDYDATLLNEVINAFSDFNAVANYKVDETALPNSGTIADISIDWPPTSIDESSMYLDLHRNPALSAYIHVMSVNNIVGYGGFAEQSAPGDPPSFGGVLAEIRQTDTLRQRVGLFIHEVGHALGSHHEDNLPTSEFDPLIDAGGEICNQYNIMGYSYCAIDANVLFGTGNSDRRYGATEAIGMPRFSIESIRLFNYNMLLSVQTGNNMAGMLFV